MGNESGTSGTPRDSEAPPRESRAEGSGADRTGAERCALGPVDPQPTEQRAYTSYPLITFFAKDDQEAANKIHALDAQVNGLDDIVTELTEECYRLGFDNQDTVEGIWDVPESTAPSLLTAKPSINEVEVDAREGR